MANKVKVSGYSKKITYDYGNVEYREFSPDLVGNQLTSNGGATLFTMGNFSITTNLDPKINKNYINGAYSDFITLDNLKLSVEESKKLLNDNTKTILRLDNTILKNYALFGSMREYFRVSLEEIITNWPASLYITPSTTLNGFDYFNSTYLDYTYDSLYDVSTFKVDSNLIDNKFEINFLNNGTIIDTFNETNPLRNLTTNYKSYVILNNDKEYKILSFTGASSLNNSYIYFKVEGCPFTGTGTTNYVYFHIKPNKTIENKFFNNLDGIKTALLNRETVPKYKATFTYPMRSDTGIIIYTEKNITWPVNDGYNIDFNNTNYLDYAESLLDLSFNYDINETNLVARFLVSESISAFDTVPVHLAEVHEDTTTGQKMTKTLNVYGRSFDDINQFIDGISLARSVTYNKQDNLPDKYLKDLAKLLGWDLVNLITDTDLTSNYTKIGNSEYAGMSVGLTPVQKDLEMWRRIILNTPWIWKSKGARNSIEFFLNFMGIPKGLYTFNEYIYKAKQPIDIDLFIKILEKNNLPTDLSLYSVDSDGYPKPLTNDDDLYYQSKGLWYRETGGSASTVDILYGNNPHIGEYDNGSTYINQFRNLIKDFIPTLIQTETSETNKVNLFTNYVQGDITTYTGPTYVDILNQDNVDISDCVVYTSEILLDPMPTQPITECGCPCEGIDEILSICIDKANATTPRCNDIKAGTTPKKDIETGFYVITKDVLDKNGTSVGTTESVFMSKTCCTAIGGVSTIMYSQYINGLATNGSSMSPSSGYVCCSSKTNCGCIVACKWKLLDNSGNVIPPIQIPQNSGNLFLKFKTFLGPNDYAVVTPDGSHCIPTLTTPIANILDPYTNEVGFGCRLTPSGINDLQLGINSEILQYVNKKIKGQIPCCSNGTNITKSLYE